MLALLLGCAIALPQLIAIERLGKNFQGIYPTNNDDELYYFARVRDVIDGHPTVAQPYLWEGKDRLPLQFWLPDYVVAQFVSASGFGLHQVFIFMDFILPAVVCILTYAIAFVLSASRLTALVTAILLCFGMHFALLNRPISPQLNLIFFLGFILASLHWSRAPSLRSSIILGIAFGLLFHVYAYYWTYAVVALALACLGYLFLRELLRVKQLLVISAIAAVIALPYIFQLLQSFGYEFYSETVARVGMIETRMPSGVYIVGLAAVYTIFLAALLMRKRITLTPETILVSALVFAAPIVTNQHLLTGQNLEFSSHYRWLASFVSVFGFVHLLTVSGVVNGRGSRRFVTLSVGALVGYSLMSAGATAFAQTFMRQDEIGMQRYAPLLVWLQEHAQPDDVVFADEELSRIIPVYTSQNVLYVREANLHYMHDREVEERFLAQNYFEAPLTREDIPRIERAVWGTYYINRWQHAQQLNKLSRMFGFSGQYPERFPQDRVDALIEHDLMIKKQSFRSVLAPYRVNYVVWDTKKYPNWAIDDQMKREEFLAEVGDGFRVYRMQ